MRILGRPAAEPSTIGSADGCARAASGHAAALPSRPTNFRRPMLIVICPSQVGSCPRNVGRIFWSVRVRNLP
jgi:hypothetical protein